MSVASPAFLSEPDADAQTLSVAVIAADGTARARITDVLGRTGIECAVAVESMAELRRGVGAVDAVAVWLRSAGRDSLAVLKTARAVFDGAPITVIWAGCARDAYKQSLMLGIDALVLEEHVERALPACLRAAHRGLLCFPRRRTPAASAKLLSSREKQVLGMLVMGFTNAEIGSRLFLAESTVKSHLSSAYEKLGVRSRKDAAALILDPYRGLGTGILAM